MKKFKFSLQGLLNARAAQKDAIILELGIARQRQAAEEAALRQIIHQIAGILAVAMPVDAPSASDFLLRERYLNLLKKKRREQQVRRDAAEAAIKVCLAKLRQADIELKKMEKLRDHEHSDWELDFQKEEQKLSDEIGMTLNFYQSRIQS